MHVLVWRGQFCEFGPHPLPCRFIDSAVQNADSANVVGARADQFSVGEKIDFRAATADVDIDVVAVAVLKLFDVIVIYDAGLLFAGDDFNLYAGVFEYVLDEFGAVGRVAHG